jgi:hypothetical protein
MKMDPAHLKHKKKLYRIGGIGNNLANSIKARSRQGGIFAFTRRKVEVYDSSFDVLGHHPGRRSLPGSSPSRSRKTRIEETPLTEHKTAQSVWPGCPFLDCRSRCNQIAPATPLTNHREAAVRSPLRGRKQGSGRKQGLGRMLLWLLNGGPA